MSTTTINEGSVAAGSSGSSLAVSYTTLRNDLGHYLGYDKLAVASWETRATNIVDRAIQSGLRRFYWPPPVEGHPSYEWSFLRKTTTLSLASGTATYSLPADFAMFVGEPTVDGTGALEIIEPDLLAAKTAVTAPTGVPRYGAMRPRTPDATSGSRYELVVTPTPTATGTLRYRYVFEPDMIDATNLYPYGGVVHGETIRESCLAAAEAAVNSAQSVHESRFQQCLLASIRLDLEVKR